MGKSIVLFITFLTSLPYLGLSQTEESKAIDKVKKHTNADTLPIQKSSCDLKVVGDEWAEAAANWTAEEKEWFKSTFIIKRGCFRVPENSIIDYKADTAAQPYFCNGSIARCSIPSQLFSPLDSNESEVVIVRMYMPMKFEETGEINKKKEKETIQNIIGAEEKMYFLGFDLLNENLDIYTCEGHLMSIPIKSYRWGSNKLIIKTEDDRFSGRYEIEINRNKRAVGVVYDKRRNRSEILYSTKPELIQFFK
jgi:hypothetical protein